MTWSESLHSHIESIHIYATLNLPCRAKWHVKERVASVFLKVRLRRTQAIAVS